MTTNLQIMAPTYQLVEHAEDNLCADVVAFNKGFLQVSPLHRLWYQEYGNPQGMPVLSVHGGPGGGSHTRDSLLFDQNFYRIIFFDQRGAGSSLPHAETKENTTPHLIDDMEKLRIHLSIDRWILCGGSWGSALALAYGEQYPNRVMGFILRGIFLGTKAEYHRLWTGMGDIYPEEFDRFMQFLPQHERQDPMTSFHKKLMDADPAVHMKAARAFCRYDFQCATIFDKARVETQLADDKRVLALARLFAHYSVNEFYFAPDQLMKEIDRITHVPAIIVHGRYDIICRISSAYRLHQQWPASQLFIVQDGGHSSFDPGMKKALRLATEGMRTRLV